MELGTPAAIMRLVDPPGVHPYPYDVAPDGRILALTPASGAVQDLTADGADELAGGPQAVTTLRSWDERGAGLCRAFARTRTARDGRRGS